MTINDPLRPEWLPRDEFLPMALVPSGRWWHGVRVPPATAPMVLARLNCHSGPVIEDLPGWTWLVPLDAGEMPLSGAQLLPEGHLVAVPPPGRRHRGHPRWLGALTPTCLTDSRHLRQALTAIGTPGRTA
ncbi:hypothetical protein RM780_05130 [Streptomyces sp. DSM 44917]|uniref:Uncharacterized protein n=1 Tax=Streptomyces boetiae TaxID=3075541 RepID=A0ABU2L4V0_9ACTN|nr:hypothetical protein [Streptomyces sp. DSM 44917]MDT0306343.1 hypothetical protein [Streptomyces sp. DSM 44917]